VEADLKDAARERSLIGERGNNRKIIAFIDQIIALGNEL